MSAQCDLRARLKCYTGVDIVQGHIEGMFHSITREPPENRSNLVLDHVHDDSVFTAKQGFII